MGCDEGWIDEADGGVCIGYLMGSCRRVARGQKVGESGVCWRGLESRVARGVAGVASCKIASG